MDVTLKTKQKQKQKQKRNQNKMTTVYLECHEGKSNKFYEIIIKGNDVTTRYGACGAAGVTAVKSFDNPAAAKKFMDKTVAEKEKKGYCAAVNQGVAQEKDEEEQEEDEAKPVKDGAKGKKNLKKRGTDYENEQPKSSKIAKKTPFVETLIERLVTELRTKAAAQKELAKKKGWTYDPRPAIDPNNVTLAHVLRDLKGYTAGTIDALVSALAKEGDLPFLAQVGEEFGSSQELFSESQLQALAIHRFLEGTLARNFLDVLKDSKDLSWENAGNAKELLTAFKTHFPMARCLEKFPIAHAYQVDASEVIPPVEDPEEKEDEENDDEDDEEDENEEEQEEESDAFVTHMGFIYQHLDKFNCRCFGRIVAAFNHNEDLYGQFIPKVEDGEADEDDDKMKQFLAVIKQKYSMGKALAKLSKPQIYALAVREMLKEPLDCRTFFGCFTYNTIETDYSGTLGGIAEFAYDQAMHITSSSYVVTDILKFIRECLILGENDDFSDFIITSSYYIPGMKTSGSSGEDEDNGDEGDEASMEEDDEN
jgi:predicted DNA-binding WGR domain protein